MKLGSIIWMSWSVLGMYRGAESYKENYKVNKSEYNDSRQKFEKKKSEIADKIKMLEESIEKEPNLNNFERLSLQHKKQNEESALKMLETFDKPKNNPGLFTFSKMVSAGCLGGVYYAIPMSFVWTVPYEMFRLEMYLRKIVPVTNEQKKKYYLKELSYDFLDFSKEL